MNMDFIRKLPIPMETKEMYPVTPALAATIDAGRQELKRIFAGQSEKVALIIGPCSADREDSVLEYLTRLARVAEVVADRICIVPRLYTNKPRSNGDDYKGLLHQPDPTAAPDLFRGIVAMRQLHMRAVQETGLVCADEILYTESYKYIDDLLGYATVGARSVEDQQHRFTASAAEVPVGMKNPTSGDLTVLVNAIRTAQHPHDFIYRGWEGRSHGNPFAHAVLRGYVNRDGDMLPNYSCENLEQLAQLYAEAGLANPAVLVDCNHCNSGKDPFRQPDIVREVLAVRADDGDLRRLVKGFMVESYLVDGSQPVGGGVYGQSITDACLGWERSQRLILDLADAW